MWNMGGIKTLPNLFTICLFICMFTYLCVVYFRNVYIRAQGHMSRYVCTWSQNSTFSIFLCHSPPYFFEAGPLTGPEVQEFGESSLSESSRDSPIFTCQVVVLQECR